MAAWETAKAFNPATPGATLAATAEQYDNLIQLAKFRRPPFNTTHTSADTEVSFGPSHHKLNLVIFLKLNHQTPILAF